MVPPHRLPLLGPQHPPLYAEVYPDDGYHADEAGGEAAVEGADALLPEYPGASVYDALVRYEVGVVQLRYQTGLDGIHGYHYGDGGGGGYAPHDAVLYVPGGTIAYPTWSRFPARPGHQPEYMPAPNRLSSLTRVRRPPRAPRS